MYRKDYKRVFLSIVLGVAAALLFAANSASAQSTTIVVDHCGQTLYPSGEYTLTTDLDCSGTFTNGLNITASNVIFHLAGHKLVSNDCDLNKDINGIFVQGGLTAVRIEGGTVQGFNNGIVLSSSQSRVTAMTVTKACQFGIALQGSANKILTNKVTLARLDGIGIGPGGGNLISSNDVFDNFRIGVEIGDSIGNTVQNNIINNNGVVDHEQGGVAIFGGSGNVLANNALNNNFSGIEIESPNSTATGNTVSGSLDTGIFIMGGSPSAVRGNTVYGSTFVDMLDDQVACGTDAWAGNNFQTDLVHNVPDGGPKKGCLR